MMTFDGNNVGFGKFALITRVSSLRCSFFALTLMLSFSTTAAAAAAAGATSYGKRKTTAFAFVSNNGNKRTITTTRQRPGELPVSTSSTTTTTTTRLYAEQQEDNKNEDGDDGADSILLKPFPEAADPKYICYGPVGENDFVLTRTGGPTKEELSNDNMLQIVLSQCTDLEVNTLVWKCLGYRYEVESETWKNDDVFPKWKEKHPNPPDLIGMQRIYSPDVDKASLKSNQDLVRSVPMQHKQSLKEHLKPLGFRGYKLNELTPNKTRRAQCTNWLLYYREVLYGKSVEQLRQERQQKQQQEQQKNQAKEIKEEEAESSGSAFTAEPNWKPPVKEVF